MLFIIIRILHVSGGFPAHHQELIKLYVQPWVLSCFPAVFFLRLIYCSEMYKCLHELYIKTVPDTNLHETSDLT
jgi:hypothetical protein